MPSGAEINSSIPSNGTEQTENTINNTNEPTLIRSISHDPTSYVQRARTTRAAPPKPATNPLQFVQMKPCNLYQSAQAQLKRAEEVKKVKEVKKEEPEDWQSNLDSWKCGRRKRVEHIIDRVVEVKKLELEEHDKSRRKSKTFSEMLVDRESKGRKVSLPIYTEDDVNDLSDLGIGTSSASGKSSLSEDFDNHSVISDNQDAEKVNSDVESQSNPDNGNRDYISSPGYDTSSSTAPASSPDLCEYTYEGAIQDYKSRVSRTQTSNFNGYQTTASPSTSSATTNHTKELLTDRSVSLDFGKSLAENSLIKRPIMTKIENQLNRFAFKLDYGNDHEQTATEIITDQPNNVPSVNVPKRRELFEKETANDKIKLPNRVTDEIGAQSISIKERLSNLEKHVDETKEDILIIKLNRLTGDFNSVKEIRTNIENPIEMSTIVNDKVKIVVPVVPLKDRLTSFNLSGMTKESVNNDNYIEDNAEEDNDNEDGPIVTNVKEKSPSPPPLSIILQQPNRLEEIVKDCLPRNRIETTDRDDSGIHTADVSCCVSQGEELLTVRSKPDYHSNGSNKDDGNAVAKDDTHDDSESSMTDECQSPPTILSPINKSAKIVQTADEIVDQIADIISADDKSTNEQDTSVSQSDTFTSNIIDIDTVKGKLVVDLKKENSVKSISSDDSSGSDNKAIVIAATTKPVSVTNNCIVALNPSSFTTFTSTSSSISVMDVDQLLENDQCKLETILTTSIENKNSQLSIHSKQSNNVNNDTCINNNNSSSSSNSSKNTDSDLKISSSVEETCKKIDIRNVPDPTHIPTPCISIGRARKKKTLNTHDKYGTNDNVFESVDDLLKADSKCQTTIENSAAKNQRIKCQIVGVLEKNRTSKLPTTTSVNNVVEKTLQASQSPLKCLSKMIKPISPCKATTVNIFDFIKRNLLNERIDVTVEPPASTTVASSKSSSDDLRIGKSTFYEPITSNQCTNTNQKVKNEDGVNVKICLKSDSIDSKSSDINSLLDEVLNKLGDDEK